jgi:hypothetical protein
VIRTLAIAAALAAAAPLAPALAADARGPGGVDLSLSQVDYSGHRDRGRHDGVGRREAVAIALRSGMARVVDVDLRGGVWEVAGLTRSGRRMELEISAWSGRVIDIDFGRGHRRDRRDHEGW